MRDLKILIHSSPLPYLLAVVAMGATAVAGIIAVELLRPKSDNVAIIAIISGFALSGTPAVLAFMKSQETHLSVNSHLEQYRLELLELAKIHAENARQQGILIGIAREKYRHGHEDNMDSPLD